jgi:hypothetical protein
MTIFEALERALDNIGLVAILEWLIGLLMGLAYSIVGW